MTSGVSARRAKVAATAAVVLLALSLSSCAKIHAEFDIKSETAYRFHAIMAVSNATIARAAAITGSSRDATLAEIRLALMSNFENLDTSTMLDVSDYDDGEFVGTEATSAVDMAVARLNDSEGMTTLSITKVDSEFILEGAVDLSDPEYSSFAVAAGATPSDVEIQVTFTFPGRVKSGNGVISGRSIVFRPTIGEVTQIEAVASAQGGPSLFLLAGIGVFAVICAFVLIRTLRGGAGTVNVPVLAVPAPPATWSARTGGPLHQPVPGMRDPSSLAPLGQAPSTADTVPPLAPPLGASVSGFTAGGVPPSAASGTPTRRTMPTAPHASARSFEAPPPYRGARTLGAGGFLAQPAPAIHPAGASPAGVRPEPVNPLVPGPAATGPLEVSPVGLTTAGPAPLGTSFSPAQPGTAFGAAQAGTAVGPTQPGTVFKPLGAAFGPAQGETVAGPGAPQTGFGLAQAGTVFNPTPLSAAFGPAQAGTAFAPAPGMAAVGPAPAGPAFAPTAPKPAEPPAQPGGGSDQFYDQVLGGASQAEHGYGWGGQPVEGLAEVFYQLPEVQGWVGQERSAVSGVPWSAGDSQLFGEVFGAGAPGLAPPAGPPAAQFPAQPSTSPEVDGPATGGWFTPRGPVV
ncbi:MAG: hypothetical protein LBD90_05570 [Bifidobacteriaceae bacterium]|jgi:hypothetical protein|nr:hypothetical protein [Bifidobacteriaceae bacterium]